MTRPDTKYDFGDSWEHELAVEASAVADADTVYPACTGGEGACPPEDCGGPGGFADLKDLLAGPHGCFPGLQGRAAGLLPR